MAGQNVPKAPGRAEVPQDAPIHTRDCYDRCNTEYDTCMARAGSDAEKAACKIALDRCITNC